MAKQAAVWSLTGTCIEDSCPGRYLRGKFGYSLIKTVSGRVEIHFFR
jgi:hypothetical protein